MADEAANREAFRNQARWCVDLGAPGYARLCDALADGLTRRSRTGARLLDWPGDPVADAIALRLLAGIHALLLAGQDDELSATMAGAPIGDVDAIVARHDALLAGWLDGPPQTNEPGRAAALMRGLIEVARRHGPRLELLEIGSSAGLNLLIGRYRIDLGGLAIGPADGPLIRPEWRGPPPSAAAIEIVSARGCDLRPIDAADPATGTRLRAYVWPEAPERLIRLDAAIALLRRHPVDLVRADAADWLEARLAEPQAAGVTRVLMHSVVRQYLSAATGRRIDDAMRAAATRAAADAPLAWVTLEPNPDRLGFGVRVASWPGNAVDARSIDQPALAFTHPHAAWIEEVESGG